jgi:perosamine synthetase
MEELIFPPLRVPHSRISWFVYVVRLHERFTRQHRYLLLRSLQEEGIGCGRYFAPIHLQPSYRGWSNAQLPVTESESARTLALPFFNNLSQAQIEEVGSALRRGISRFV